MNLETAVGDALGSTVLGMRPLSGGDINDAYLAELANGERVFVKSHKRAPQGMFSAEAAGLAWLREADALQVPEVLAVSDARPAFLVLSYVAPGPAVRDFDERLGRGLARLHQHGADGFGLPYDNFIGSLCQINETRPTWVEFLVEQRLQVQVQIAVDSGVAPRNWVPAFERLYRRLPNLVPGEPPHRLHGDLWGGNLHRTQAGEPCLIDPAVYGGNREMDLALMRLFGGFSPDVFAAYEEFSPLEAGAASRVPLYQLYPLLVHVNLFGGSYVGSVERALHCMV